MNLMPIGKRLLVKMLAPDTTTPGGIHLHTLESYKAKIISLGDGAKEEFGDKLTTGDVVFLPRGSKSGDAFPDGDDLYLLIPTTMVSGKFI